MSQNTQKRGFSSLGQTPPPPSALKTQEKIEKGKEIVNSRNVNQGSFVDVPITDMYDNIVGFRRVPKSSQLHSNDSFHIDTSSTYGKNNYPRYQRKLLDERHYAFHDNFFVPFKTVINDLLFRAYDSRSTASEKEYYFLSQETADFIGNYSRMLVAYVRMHNDSNLQSNSPDENFNVFTRVVISKVSKLLKQTAYVDGKRRGNEFLGDDVTFGFIYGISRDQDESGLSKHPNNGGSTWEDAFTSFMGKIGMLNPKGGFRTYDEVSKLSSPSENQRLYIKMYEIYRDISAQLQAQREYSKNDRSVAINDEDDDIGNRV